MRFDIFSVFPDYLSALDLSLIGKARAAGTLEVNVHDVRDWTTDKHRTVDDTPAGGGAGMVMRPDVWGLAIDSVLQGGRTILAIPTPAGEPLTQRRCEDLAARADQIIIACGRYEGIDSRVGEHYGSQGVEVIEFSLGDYVLNGGEVAALALVEAVGRLVPGVVGNPASLVEESHGDAGLLEYPNYTRPVSWRGHDIPEILSTGDHGKVARWRRDRALEKTSARRPDMIGKLDVGQLDKKDRAQLATLGWYWPAKPEPGTHPQRLHIETDRRDAAAYSALAFRTFPHACPAGMSEADIDAFMNAHLSPDHFLDYAGMDEYLLLGVRVGDELVGYALAHTPNIDPVSDGAPTDLGENLVELSKFYIERDWRGTFVADALMAAVRDKAGERFGDPVLWLGTNVANKRAIRFYRSHGFTKVGNRTFYVGDQANEDLVMGLVRPVAY